MAQGGNRAVGDVFCKGAVYDGSNTYWSTRECADVGGDVPLDFKVTFDLRFKFSNMASAGYKVAKEDDVGSVL